MYTLYLYFLELSLKSTSKALEPFKKIKGVMLLYGTRYNNLIQNSLL
jgi:hypothetical protein